VGLVCAAALPLRVAVGTDVGEAVNRSGSVNPMRQRQQRLWPGRFDNGDGYTARAQAFGVGLG
jgi:hypothetical protein